MAGGELRNTVANRVPVFTADGDEADVIVEADQPGRIRLAVRTQARELCSLSVGAEEAVHLIRLLSTELTNTRPLQGFVPEHT